MGTVTPESVDPHLAHSSGTESRPGAPSTGRLAPQPGPPDNMRSRNASFVIADAPNYFPWKPKIRRSKLISSPLPFLSPRDSVHSLH